MVAVLSGLALLLPGSVRAADPFEIDVILSLTGSGGFIGKTSAIGLQAVENRVRQTGGINGRPIKFVIHDDGTNPQVAVQIMSDLVAKKVPVVLGSSLAATCDAIMPVAKNGPVVFCLSNAVYPPPGSFMFAALVTTLDHIGTGIRFARLSNKRRVALIVSTDTSGQNGERALDTTLATDDNKSVTLVAREHFNVSDITVAAQLARIKAAKPDLLVVWTAGTGAGTVLRGILDTGLEDVPILMSPGNATYAQMEQYTRFLPKEMYFTLNAAMLPDRVADRATRSADKDIKEALTPLSVRVDSPLASTWDSALIVLSAFRKLGMNASAEQLRTYFANLKGFTASAGRYDFTVFPQRGIGEASEIIGRWDATQNTWVTVSKPGGAPL